MARGRWPLVVGALVVGTVLAGAARAQVGRVVVMEDPPVTVDEVVAALSPHGEWLEVAPYGRVWRPDDRVVGEDFTPYLTGGRWLPGVYGWTFDSSYPWGWAAFHFGRWVYVDDHAGTGWVWSAAGETVPQWGAAWVTWRTAAGGLAGWVAAPPAGATVDPRVYGGLWLVVQKKNLMRADLERHLLPPERIGLGTFAAPALIGVPVTPRPSWRGYPQLRTALAVASGALPVVVGGPAPDGTNSTLWLGLGSSVHAPMDMGRAAGASPLGTGPGSSVHPSPPYGTFGPSAGGVGAAGRSTHSGRSRR
jgi:hypothetical protein